MTDLRQIAFVSTSCLLFLLALPGCSRQDDPSETDDAADAIVDESLNEPKSDLEAVVARMAEIGWATGATYSPDGDRIAYISGETGTPQVFVFETGTGESRQVTSSDDPVTSVRWSPAGETLAIAVAPGGGLNSQLYLTSTAGEELRLITAGGKVNNWLGEWSDDGRYLAYSSNAGNPGSMDCYLYDVGKDEAKFVADNEGIGVIANLSPNGERAVIWRMKSRGDTNLYLLELASGREQLLTPHDGVAVSDYALFADDDTIFIATNVDREMAALGRIDIDDAGNAGSIRIVAERDDADLEEFGLLGDGTQAALVWNAAGRSEVMLYSVDDEAMTAGPELPAEIAGGIAVDKSGGQFAITVSGAATPQDVWRFDVASGVFSKVSSSSHDGVDLATLVRPELVRYEAHDGLELTGWLYRPHGAAGPGPVVTSFHGGPEGQERPRFRSTYQALLSRGIGVFAPNVRGSSGFGKTFVNLDNGRLRFDGIRDIESTFKYLVESGIADPDRVGIMGGSYGGYMVMAGLVHYPDMFHAGANLFGVVNFETFFANTEPWMAAISTIEYGDPATEPELLESLSPIHQVDKVVAPTIVLHGANDTNVPVVEAEQVVESLRAREIPVKYVLFPDEGHGWRKTANRVTSDVEIVRWFENHLATVSHSRSR